MRSVVLGGQWLIAHGKGVHQCNMPVSWQMPGSVCSMGSWVLLQPGFGHHQLPQQPGFMSDLCVSMGQLKAHQTCNDSGGLLSRKRQACCCVSPRPMSSVIRSTTYKPACLRISCQPRYFCVSISPHGTAPVECSTRFHWWWITRHTHTHTHTHTHMPGTIHM